MCSTLYGRYRCIVTTVQVLVPGNGSFQPDLNPVLCQVPFGVAREPARLRLQHQFRGLGQALTPSLPSCTAYGAQSMKVYDCVVQSVKPYGAFVELEGGVVGLLHISQISQERVEDVEDVLEVGDKVKVLVTSKDYDKGQLALTTKKLEPSPGEGCARVHWRLVHRGGHQALSSVGKPHLSCGLPGQDDDGQLPVSRRPKQPRPATLKPAMCVPVTSLPVVSMIGRAHALLLGPQTELQRCHVTC